MSRSRRLNWGIPESPPPAHPYRDTLIIFGVLAVGIVVLAVVVGSAVGKAVVVAGAFFVLASAYNLVRWRSKLRADARQARIEEDLH